MSDDPDVVQGRGEGSLTIQQWWPGSWDRGFPVELPGDLYARPIPVSGRTRILIDPQRGRPVLLSRRSSVGKTTDQLREADEMIAAAEWLEARRQIARVSTELALAGA